MAKKDELEKIARQIEECRRCPLWKRPRAVPGAGNPNSEIMFVGEAPGFHESQQGLPFVGAAGKLLDRLLRNIGLDRKDVWIGNILKHRPPNNRDPLPLEIEACRLWLDEQIKIIDPKIIVTLGRFSMNKFLPGEYISKIHGQARFVNFGGKKRIVVPMYHPAAALRRGEIMQQEIEDFKKLPEILKGERETANSSLEEKKEEQEINAVQLKVFD